MIGLVARARFLVIASVLAAGLSPALGQVDALSRLCDSSEKSRASERIAACSKVIARGIYFGLPLDRARAYTDRAWAYRDKGDYRRGIADLETVLRIDPSYIPESIENSIGVFYLELGDHNRAIEHFSKSIDHKPTYYEAYYQRGLAYLKKGEAGRAIADMDRAIEGDEKRFDYHFSRAKAHLLNGDYAKAAADFRVIVTRYPALGEAREALAKIVAEHPELGSESAQNKTAQPTKSAEPVSPATSEAGIAKADPPTTAAAMPGTKVAKAEPAKPDPAPKPTVSAAPLGVRVALVIGNGKYRFAPVLPNPPNDARDLSAALRELGFKVIEGYDLDSAGMRAKIAEFGAAMPGAATTLFFYAGHGVQVAGKNYLVPTDAKLERPSALNIEAIEVGTILADMETEQRTNLVFLDACRDNPLARSLARSFGATRSSSVGQGLAQLNAGIGTLITFATSPDNVALDGSGKHSPFTAALLRHIRTPNIEIRTMITRVRADVFKATRGKQTPWDHSSLLGEFYFRRGG